MQRVEYRRLPACLFLIALVGCFFVAWNAPADARPRTIVSLEFDDAYADQFNVRDELASHGIAATFFLNSSLIGTPGYMSVSQLLQLQGDGHEMAGHSRHHYNLPDLSASMQLDEICGDRTLLNSWDLAAHDFAYPNGSLSPVTQAIVSSCGYNSGRTVGGLTPPALCGPNCRPAETLPPGDLMATITVPTSAPAGGLKTLQRYLLDARRIRHGWVQYVFHHVCDGCNRVAVRPAVFRAFLDWLKSPRIGPRIKLLRIDALTGLPGPGR
ncbi:MAG: polysaccharide deacetylase family protein [Solirubrobacterales bacterium]